MALSLRKIGFMKSLRRYHYLTAALLRDLHVPNDKGGAITRGICRDLERMAFVKRNNPKLVDPLSGSVAPIWALTMKGSEVLFTETGDPNLLLAAEPSFSNWTSLNHFVRVSAWAMAVDAAFAKIRHAVLKSLFFEHEKVNLQAEGGLQYRLYSVVQETPRICCCPDAAIEIQVGGWRRAWYLEYETGSDGSPARVAALKHKGFDGLAKRQLFRRHFPEANDMRVLCLVPHASWRDTMRKTMAKLPGANLWTFLSTPDFFKAENPLTAELLYTVDGGPYSIIPRSASVSATPSGGGAAEGTVNGAACHA